MKRTDKYPYNKKGISRSFSAETVLIDGMQVIFDERAELLPVDLVEKGKAMQIERLSRSRQMSGVGRSASITKGDVVIFMSGLAVSGSGSIGSGSSESSRSSGSDSKSSGSSGYEDDLEAAFDSRKNEIQGAKPHVRSYVSGWADGETKSTVSDFIKEKLANNGKLILVGYSWGGDTALEIADEFNTKHPEFESVALHLVLIDPADGPFQENNTVVSPRVKTATNYYQPNRQAVTLSGNRRLTKATGSSTVLRNVLITHTSSGEVINHSNIYAEVTPNVVSDVIRILNSN